MKSLISKFVALVAALMVAGIFTVISANPASARGSYEECPNGTFDYHKDGNNVLYDNGTATYRVQNRTFTATGVAPWNLRGGGILMGTNGSFGRWHSFGDAPNSYSFKFAADETQVLEIKLVTDYPGCNDGEPIPGSDNCGYYLIGRDGGVFTYGKAKFFGSTGAMRLNQPVFGMASTKSGNGYWLVAYDGGIFSFGDARFFGSTGAMKLNQPITGMARTASGNGYWLVAKDGGIFSFGDAKFFGSTGAMRLSAPIVSMIATSSGNGYWLITADGKVFAFGDAVNYGGGGQGTIVGGTATGNGYRYVNTKGDMFGSTSSGKFQAAGPGSFRAPVIGVANDPSSAGYWLASAAGEVYPVNTTSYCGSASHLRLNQPIIGFAAVG